MDVDNLYPAGYGESDAQVAANGGLALNSGRPSGSIGAYAATPEIITPQGDVTDSIDGAGSGTGLTINRSGLPGFWNSDGLNSVDEWGQPLNGRSNFSLLQAFTQVLQSDDPLTTKLGQFGDLLTYSVPDASQLGTEINAKWLTEPNPSFSRIDRMEASPIAGIAGGASIGLSASPKTQDLWVGVGQSLEGLALAGAGLTGRLPDLFDAQRPTFVEAPPYAPTSQDYAFGLHPYDTSELVMPGHVSEDPVQHEAAVIDFLKNSDDYGQIGSQVHLKVTLSDGTSFKIIPDALEQTESGDYRIHDAKFGFDDRDMINGNINLSNRQTTAFPEIASGTARVEIANSRAGQSFFGSDFQVGAEIKMDPQIKIYVNTPRGIVVRTNPFKF